MNLKAFVGVVMRMGFKNIGFSNNKMHTKMRENIPKIQV